MDKMEVSDNKGWLSNIFLKHKKKTIALGIVSIMQSICVIEIARVVQDIINVTSERSATGMISQVFIQQICVLIVIVILNSIFNYLLIFVKAKISAQSCKQLRKMSFEKVQRIQVSYLENEEKGKVLSKLTNDIGMIEEFLDGSVKDIVYLPCNIILLSIYMIQIDYRLYLASILIIPIIMVISGLIARTVTRLSIELQKKVGKSTSLVVDTISGIEVIKSFNLQERYIARFQEVTLEIFRKQIGLVRRIASITPFLYVLKVIPRVACIITGGYLIMAQKIAAGDLIAFLLLIGTMSENIYMLPNLFNNYKKTNGVIQNMSTLWQAPEDKEVLEIDDKGELSLNIRFDNLGFSYTDSKAIINNIDLEIEGPQIVAIVGESGAGKSTLVKMLLGYYLPTKGQIAINNILITEENLYKCRAQIAFVSQETYLFCDTIYNNIACAYEGVSPEEVYKAAKDAGIHDFIMNLENGYETKIEEKGSNFSGGEKQRIAIARALLKRSPIILLDEPTSAVDIGSELKIIDTLKKIKDNKIVIIISHRPTTIKIADKIYVLKDGEIVESGAYDNLINEESYFKQMYLGTVG